MLMKSIINAKNNPTMSRLSQRFDACLSISLTLWSLMGTPAYAKEDGKYPNAFFAYLANCQSAPALVAFNPTRYDPRRPLDLNDAALASLRDDLKALTSALMVWCFTSICLSFPVLSLPPPRNKATKPSC